jgi:serine/threonine-protein kinase RsbW
MRMRMILSLPRTAASVAVARHTLDRIFGTFGVRTDCRQEIAIAVSEACSNAVQHAVGEPTYDLFVETEGDECVIMVDDRSSATDVPVPPDMPEATAVAGRGLAIMSMTMDRVELNPAPTGGLLTLLQTAAVERRITRQHATLGLTCQAAPTRHVTVLQCVWIRLRVGAPTVHQYDAGVDQLQVLEKAVSRRLVAHGHCVRRSVVLAGDVGPGRAVELAREGRQRQVASRHEPVEVPPDKTVGILVISNKVNNRKKKKPYRLGEVQRRLRLLEDLVRIPHIGVDIRGPALGRTG